jgi:hypothetical protein
MRIFLDGLEYKAYREIMQDLGVRFGCLNYEYIWARTPRFSLSEDTSFLEELIVHPGTIKSDYYYDDYIKFLNYNKQYISFALSQRSLDGCDVETIPYITFDLISKPFAKIKYKQRVAQGELLHADGFELPYLDSFNTGLWMRGRAGIISEFIPEKMDKKMQVHAFDAGGFSTSVARKLIKEGYDIDLLRIKKKEWREIAKVNCISWMKYQEYKEDEWMKSQ